MRDIESLLPDGKGVWIPIDHGVSDYPVKGLENLESLIQSISHADAIVLLKELELIVKNNVAILSQPLILVKVSI